MRKLAHFELKSVLSAIDDAELTQNYDFSNLVACGISLEAIRLVYRLKTALKQDSDLTVANYIQHVNQVYTVVDSFYGFKEMLGYDVLSQEFEREEKLLQLIDFVQSHGMDISITTQGIAWAISVRLE
ncbi:hypothetical protein [Vibrio splendidus]|uniref:hypothetical protein n=1 Tax=Vibrio splendidus TaxID=29497 RepID=UPI000C858456|nr:hypothetical protein [Vibrio splendidus]PMP36344.1 hypothetical protein BCS86_23385 [Vibrio splendidus]